MKYIYLNRKPYKGLDIKKGTKSYANSPQLKVIITSWAVDNKDLQLCAHKNFIRRLRRALRYFCANIASNSVLSSVALKMANIEATKINRVGALQSTYKNKAICIKLLYSLYLYYNNANTIISLKTFRF